MISVRVPSSAMPTVVSEGRLIPMRPDHPQSAGPCPVCGGPLAGKVIVLVFCGIAPENRKSGGWTKGAAVAVHATCAGVSEEASAPDPTARPTPATS